MPDPQKLKRNGTAPGQQSSLLESEVDLPSKDPFFKTNKIFNSLFNKDIVLKEGPISKTNINGIIWVNFGQVVLRSVVREDGADFLLDCNHPFTPRGHGFGLDKPSKGMTVACYKCGMLNAYRSFEHEWSHIIFKSSPAMFDKFLQIYAAHYGSFELTELIALLVNAFDDFRVNSLWTLVYPGSAAEIEGKWKELVNNSSEVNTNLITWLFGVGLGSSRVDKNVGPFHDLIPIASKAIQAVKGRGTANMLAIVRWFLEQCIDRLIHPSDHKPKESEREKDRDEGEKGNNAGKNNPSPKTAPSMSRDEAVQKLSTNLRDFNRAQAHHLIDKANYVSKIAYKLQKSEEDSLSAIMKLKIDELKDEEIPDLSPQGSRRPIDGDMEDAIKALQASGGEDVTQNQYLLSEVENVLIADVLPENITPGSRIILTLEQQSDIARMRAVFAKFIGKKMARLVEDGDEVNVQALVQYRLDGQNDDVFEDEGLTKGFAYLTLCDMSDSMDGSPFNYVCLGSEMLKKAMDYPFVNGHLWGFRGAIGAGSENYVTTREKLLAATKGGEVWIYKYAQECDGYIATEVETNGIGSFPRDKIPVKCGGMTPTSTGIHLAAKYLGSNISSGVEKRIFLLTDGNPTQFRLNGSDIPRDALLRSVRKEVDAARSKGIKIYTTILGNEITEKDAEEMFGSPAFWRRVPADLVGQALLEMVITQFVGFLRQ